MRRRREVRKKSEPELSDKGGRKAVDWRQALCEAESERSGQDKNFFFLTQIAGL
jgi:hypothetical protein